MVDPDSNDVEEILSSSVQNSSSSAKSSLSSEASSSSSSQESETLSSSSSTEESSDSQGASSNASQEGESSSSQETASSSSSDEFSSSSQEEESSSSQSELESSSSEKEKCVPQEYKKGTFLTWHGDGCNSRVYTGLDNGSGTSGVWFTVGDDAEGGASQITWPVPVELNDDPEHVMDPVKEECHGICGTANLNKGSLEEKAPFMGIGFNIGGLDKGNKPVPIVASSWEGVCISYTSDVAPYLELGLGDEFDASIKYANPRADLPKSASGTTIKIEWHDFKQPSWYTGSTRISGSEAAAQLVSLVFKIQSTSISYINFNIMSIGPLNGDCRKTSYIGVP